MDMDMLWEEYQLEDFQKGLQSLFPESRISLEVLLDYIWEGNILEALGYLGQGLWDHGAAQLMGVKNIFVWLLCCYGLHSLGFTLVTYVVSITDLTLHQNFTRLTKLPRACGVGTSYV